MNVGKLYETFPIYLIKDFEQVEDSLRIALMAVVLENKVRNHEGNGGSFLINEDYRGFFKYLYNKFFEASKTIFGDFTTSDNNESCWSYASNKFHHGTGVLHNHLNTSTINSSIVDLNSEIFIIFRVLSLDINIKNLSNF